MMENAGQGVAAGIGERYALLVRECRVDDINSQMTAQAQKPAKAWRNWRRLKWMLY
jgi:hypothetical protein